ncbi:MAG TPA: A24 family peptidase [Gaiellaceae bacterium]|jgi:leader peptidase (prepilin peptidase)/N-methyltransferase
MNAEHATRLGRDARTWWAGPAALVLAVWTFIHLGHDANAALWACTQIVLVVLAATDFAERRLPNVITIPTAVTAVVLRAVFERSHLGEAVLAGVIAFVGFYAIALIARGGFGMGDVKLAAMLGFLLAAPVLGALVVGVIVGGLAGAALLLASRAGLRSTIAYGPYLALGGAIAILGLNPPPLV